MDNNKVELSGAQVKRFCIGMMLALIFSGFCAWSVVRNSHIRNVDMIAVLGFGGTLGIFIMSLTLFFKVKKQKDSTRAGL